MRLLYPVISLVILVTISVSALTLNNFQELNNSTIKDKITIDSVSVIDPDYQCFASPCFFRSLSFNYTVVNTFEKILDSACMSTITLKILPGLHQDDQWFKINEDFMQIACIKGSKTIPAGTWQDNYSTMLYLLNMLQNDYQIPSTINVQLVLGNYDILSPIYALNL